MIKFRFHPALIVSFKAKKMKKAYREAYDAAETIEEIDAAKQLKVDYINFEHEYAKALADENKEHEGCKSGLEQC